MSGNLIGNVKSEDIKVMMLDDKSQFDLLSDEMFDKIDYNQDGFHDIKEIEDYLKTCACLTKDIHQFIEQNYKNKIVGKTEFKQI